MSPRQAGENHKRRALGELRRREIRESTRRRCRGRVRSLGSGKATGALASLRQSAVNDSKNEPEAGVASMKSKLGRGRVGSR